MTIEEYNQVLGTLLAEDTTKADIANIVNQLRTDYMEVNSTLDKTKGELEVAISESNKFAKLNNELYLQVGVTRKELENPSLEDESQDNSQQPLRFEDLDF